MNNLKKAFSEVDMILDLIDSEMKNKVSANFIKLIKEEKDNEYKPNINPEIPLEEQNILPETIDILALLKLNYWCNEEEKKELLEILNRNEQKFQKEAKEKYDIDKLFKTNKTKEIINLPEKVESENFINKLITTDFYVYNKVKLPIFVRLQSNLHMWRSHFSYCIENRFFLYNKNNIAQKNCHAIFRVHKSLRFFENLNINSQIKQ